MKHATVLLVILGFCTLLAQTQTVECDICKLAVAWVDNSLEDKSTQHTIAQLFDAACDLLGSESAKCSQFVAANLPRLLELVVTDMAPQSVCAKVDVCPIKSVQANGGVECEVCSMLFDFLYSELDKEATQHEIEKLLDSACVIFKPLGEEDQCRSVIDANEPQIVKYLQSKYSPSTICTLLGTCHKKLGSILLHHHKERLGHTDKTKRSISDESSQKRNFHFKFDFEWTDDDDDKQQIKEQPKEQVQQQQQPVIKPKPTINPLLAKQITHIVKTNPLTASPDPHQACQFCMWVISAIEAFATENTTVSELSSFVENLCTFLPSDYIETCVNFVSVYTPQLIEFISRRENPPNLCSQVAICDYN